jgi:hypothetical protein
VAVAAIITATDSESVQNLTASLERMPQVARVFIGTDEHEALAKLETALAAGLDHSNLWLWFLSADSIPQPDSLNQLLQVVEKAPSAGWVVPKVFKDASVSRELASFGQTVNRVWSPVALAEHHLDQAQYDDREELLAANRLGSIIRYDAYRDAGGFLRGTTALAADYRLAISIRLSGLRVVGAPQSKLNLSGAALPHSVSDSSPLTLLKTQIQLATAYLAWPISLLLGILAPIGAVILSLWHLVRKAPERIGATLVAGFWWFFLTPALVAKRHRFTSGSKAALAGLGSLFATSEDVQRTQVSRVDQPAAIAEANIDSTDDAPRFAASGGIWFMLALAAVSYKFWPTNLAAVGGTLLPVGSSLKAIFSAAGASWQHLGFGFAAPSDPVNWVYFVLAAATFWAPNLGISLAVFLAKPLAFAAAWRLLSLTTKKRSLIAIGALTYAFWPALSTAQLQGRFGTIVAAVLLPIFVFALARILRFGASERRSIQTWTWVGLGGLVAAAISAGAPSLTPLVAALILFLAIYRFKRIGYLIWLPLPLLVLWLPLAVNLVVGQLHPLALLTEPGVPVASSQQPLWLLALGGAGLGPFSGFSSFLLAAPVAVGLLGVFGRRSWNSLWLWLAFLSSVAGAWLFNGLVFVQHSLVARVAPERESAGSPLALLSLAGLILAVMVVLSLETASRSWRRIGAGISAVVAAALAAQFALASTPVHFTDGFTMPALVVAQAESNSQTRTLVINPLVSTSSLQMVSATLVQGEGINLSNLSTAYLTALPRLVEQDPRYQHLSDVAANLVAANGSNLRASLQKYKIDYVLVPNGGSAAATGASLDTVAELESVGTTSFGRLWRVVNSGFETHSSGWEWSVTKQVQTAVFALFALLAIPSRRRTRSGAKASDALDAFESDTEGEGF